MRNELAVKASGKGWTQLHPTYNTHSWLSWIILRQMMWIKDSTPCSAAEVNLKQSRPVYLCTICDKVIGCWILLLLFTSVLRYSFQTVYCEQRTDEITETHAGK